MGNDDARSLDHKTLEALRIRAVGSVQAGESPRLSRALWVLPYGQCMAGWRATGAAVIRPSAEVERARDAMDSRHGDAEEPVAAAIFVRIVDARDGGDADQKKIQHHAGRPVGRLLAQIGITCQKPLHRAIERDEATQFIPISLAKKATWSQSERP